MRHPFTLPILLAILAAPAHAQVLDKAVTRPAAKVDDARPVVVIETTAGAITLELDRTKTPITVDNFLKYVDEGYFDGLVFHRVIPGFMIQGGGMSDVGGNLQDKRPTHDPIKNESKTGMSNVRGTIAMARTDNPNSATAQFYINHSNNSFLDKMKGGYTAFGKVIDGMDVVDAIAKTKTDMSEGEGGVPLKPIVIKSLKRKPKS